MVRPTNEDLKKKLIAFKILEEIYEFSISFIEKDFKITKDELTYKGDFVELKRDGDTFDEEIIEPGQVVLTKSKGKINISSEGIPIEDFDVSMLREKEIKPNSLIIDSSPSISFIIPPFGNIYKNISFFDF